MRVLRNVFRRKLRAFLTIFGITIGIVALVVMGGLAEKLQLLVDGGSDYYAEKVVVAGPSAMAGFSTDPISLDLIEEIEAVEGVARVSAEITMMLDEDPSSVNLGIPSNINGVDLRGEGYEDFDFRIAEGRELTLDDAGKAVIGSDLVSKLDAEVGGTIDLRGTEFEVIGIYERTLTAPDQAVKILLGDAQELLVMNLPPAIRDQVEAKDLATSMVVYVDEGVDADALAVIIEAEVSDISAMGPTDFIGAVKEPLQIFSQIIYAVALISLMVGGMSVINTMTMSVAERTREIGIRKAIGARDRDIMGQFVLESAIMGTIGGLVGLGLGLIITTLGNAAGAESATELFLVSPRLAIGSVAFAIVLGVLSGLYPAWHAARLNPVQALRYE